MAVTGSGGAAYASRSIEQFKRGFFDSDAILKAMDKASRKALSKSGAFVRKRARSSIRKAPKVDVATGLIKRGRKKKGAIVRDATALPGKPPYGHGDQKLKRLIFFAWDTSTRSEVIGPAKFENARGAGPTFLEHGGQTTLANNRGKRRSVSYAGNPVMNPALEAEMPNILEFFRDSM